MLIAEVWSQSFGNSLGIRQSTQHSHCAVCMRHKMLIKKLASDSRARQLQLALYQKHLTCQYNDRACYWMNRASSRLPYQPSGNKKLSVITDAIDHTKFKYPRSKVFGSKEFSGVVRPSMDFSAMISHGHCLLFALSEPWVKKDSSWCSELLCHSLNLLSARGLDLRSTEVYLQADNTSRECKNNTLCRLGGVLVGCHQLKHFQLDFLMTGHSHEDVDQLFSQVSNLIEAHQELHTPSDFQKVLESWLSDKSVRAHEPYRSVVKVDQVRDWLLDSLLFSGHEPQVSLCSFLPVR